MNDREKIIGRRYAPGAEREGGRACVARCPWTVREGGPGMKYANGAWRYRGLIYATLHEALLDVWKGAAA